MGQLMYAFHSLADVERRGGRVYRGRVLATRRDGHELDLQVEQRWPELAPEPPPGLLQRWFGAPKAAPPPFLTFVLAGDTEWTDPHHSPVHFGLAGGIRQVSVGAEVLVVDGIPVEALPCNEHNLDSVRLAFEAEVRAAYPSRPEGQRVRDLLNPNRADLALASLHGVSAATVLETLNSGELRTVLGRVDTLPVEVRVRLATEALDWLIAKGRDRGDRLAVLLDYWQFYVSRLPKELLPLAARVFAVVDPNHPPERGFAYSFVRVFDDLPDLNGFESAIAMSALHGDPREEQIRAWMIKADPGKVRAALRAGIGGKGIEKERKKLAKKIAPDP